MFAGPFHNLILAVVFFTVVLVGFGVPESTTTLARVPDCVLPAGAETAGRADACEVPIVTSGADAGQICDAGSPGCALPEESPATKAGLRGRRHDRGPRRRPGLPRDRRRLDAGADGDPASSIGHPGRLHHRARRASGRTSRSRRSRTPSTPSAEQRADDRRRLRRGQPGADLRPAVGHRRPGLPRDDDRAVGGQARRRCPQRVPAAVPARPSSARSATRRGRSASSGSAASPARCSPSTSSRRRRRSATSSSCWPASTWCCSCSTCCRSTRWTAGTSPGRCTRRPGPRWPGCAAAPTRARSTSPG